MNMGDGFTIAPLKGNRKWGEQLEFQAQNEEKGMQALRRTRKFKPQEVQYLV